MSFEKLSVNTPRNAFVPSPIFVGIVALTVVSGWMAWTSFGNVRVDVFLFVICGWLLSLCLHEYAHAIVAFFSGDPGVAERGYLRLNPLKYTSPFLSIVMPIGAVVLGGIGLPGGAVLVDHGRIPSKVKRSLISVAGPATNLLFALVLAVPFLAGLAPSLERTATGEYQAVGGPGHVAFWSGFALLAVLQIMAGLLNLLPVPGLDGGNIIQPWLSPPYQRAYQLFAPFGFVLLFVVLWQSALVNRWFYTAIYWIADLLGINSILATIGFQLMRFWTGS